MADGGDQPVDGALPAADALRLARMPVNDLGMAERLRARFGARLAKTPDAGWLAYDAKAGHWQAGHRGEAQAKIYAHQTGLFIWEEIAAVQAALEMQSASELAAKEEAERLAAAGVAVLPSRPPAATAKIWEGLPEKLAKALDAAGSASGTSSMLNQAAPYLSAELADFDPDTNLICCTNGTLKPTFIGEPCFVVSDADGVPIAWALAEKAVEGGPAIELHGWRLRNIDGRTFEILEPGLEEGDESIVGKPQLQGGLSRGDTRLHHRLFHLQLDLLAHNPDHRITRQTACAWDPKARAPLWLKHIETVLPDVDDREFFHRAMGYGLIGTTQAQCFLFIQGKGADGKTTTAKVINHVTSGYSLICDPRSFLETKSKSAGEASPDMADMAGDVRFLYCEEPPKGARVNEALLKQVTGGAELRARQLHKDLFSFQPRFLLVMAFNDLPRVTGGDDGFWRRMRLIRFRHQFPESAQSDDMVERLCAEAPGILNWLLEGLAKFRKHGLKPHQAMADDIMEFRSQSDTFGEWLRDCVEKGAANDKVLNSALYKSYQAFCEAQGVGGHEVLGSKGFANRLSSQQIPLRKIGGERYRIGVRLRPEQEIAGGGE